MSAGPNIITGARATQIYRGCKMLDDERRRRLLVLEKQQREAAEEAEFFRKYGNNRKWIRPRGTMAALDFHHIMQTHSYEELHSDELWKFHQKHHPELMARKL